MEYNRPFPPRRIVRPPKKEEGCKIEVKKTRSGKKVMIGAGCTRDQIQMFKETGELNLNQED